MPKRDGSQGADTSLPLDISDLDPDLPVIDRIKAAKRRTHAAHKAARGERCGCRGDQDGSAPLRVKPGCIVHDQSRRLKLPGYDDPDVSCDLCLGCGKTDAGIDEHGRAHVKPCNRCSVRAKYRVMHQRERRARLARVRENGVKPSLAAPDHVFRRETSRQAAEKGHRWIPKDYVKQECE